MKAKAWGAVMMVAFAWVLWSKISSVGIETWSPEQGFDSKEDCEKFAVRWIDHVISKDKKKERLAINIYMEAINGERTIVSMHCFTFEFDPRPPQMTPPS